MFFADDDYELYRDLLSSQCRKHGTRAERGGRGP